MNKRMLGYLIGIILAVEAALLSVPLITALIYRESGAPFIITMAILMAVSLPLGRDSVSVSIEAPVVVKPETVSKSASI